MFSVVTHFPKELQGNNTLVIYEKRRYPSRHQFQHNWKEVFSIEQSILRKASTNMQQNAGRKSPHDYVTTFSDGKMNSILHHMKLGETNYEADTIYKSLTNNAKRRKRRDS